MGKPHIEVYEKFMEQYRRLNDRYSKEQYVVPYLMSSHPGSTLRTPWLWRSISTAGAASRSRCRTSTPTPGTISTCMYYTGIDPMTMKKVCVAKTPHEKAMQRALLQWKRPDKRRLVIEALKEAGREDLIGYGPECLVRPDRAPGAPAGMPGVKAAPRAEGQGRRGGSQKAGEQKGWGQGQAQEKRQAGR